MASSIEPQFVTKGNPAGGVSDSGDANGFMNNSSTSLGMEPMGELDGAISNLAMSAKYNLTQMTPRQVSWQTSNCHIHFLTLLLSY